MFPSFGTIDVSGLAIFNMWVICLRFTYQNPEVGKLRSLNPDLQLLVVEFKRCNRVKRSRETFVTRIWEGPKCGALLDLSLG